MSIVSRVPDADCQAKALCQCQSLLNVRGALNDKHGRQDAHRLELTMQTCVFAMFDRPLLAELLSAQTANKHALPRFGAHDVGRHCSVGLGL